jgi:hypothetical protein
MKIMKTMKTMKTGSRIAAVSKILTALAFGLFLFSGTVNAQENKTASSGNPPVVHPKPGTTDAAHDLAQASSNPIANMITLPVQNNFNFGTGEPGRMQWTTNIMPVLPFKLSKKLNMVTRLILPVQNGFPANDENGTVYGLGNSTLSFFVVPSIVKVKKGLNFTWGVGPVLSLPTASDPSLGGDAFGIGATGIGLLMAKHLVGGILLGFTDSYKTDDMRSFYGQYFFVYNIKKGWFLSMEPTFGANFNAEEGQQWSVQYGAGGGKLVKVGTQHFKLMIQGFGYFVKPDLGPDFSLQFQVMFLFPKQAK